MRPRPILPPAADDTTPRPTFADPHPPGGGTAIGVAVLGAAVTRTPRARSRLRALAPAISGLGRHEAAGAADAPGEARAVIVHLLDGTYELFRHFYGQRRFNKGEDAPYGAVAGVLHTCLELIESGATHLGVATDHVIESFRNELWPAYKTGEGVEPALRRQFHPLEEALAAMGVVVWPMVELEADDALASAARLADGDERVEQVCIWANDKDLAQCVRGSRVVQVDRRAKEIRDAEAVRKKYGVEPSLIPDLLALVGDAQDGYPGIAGIGRATATRLLDRHGPIEAFPANVLGATRERALLFKRIATLRADAGLLGSVDELEWHGPTPAFAAWAERIGDARLLERSRKAVRSAPPPSP